GGGNRAIDLLLCDISIHQATESVLRIGIEVKCLLVGFSGLAVLFLSEFQVPHLYVPERVLWSHVDGLANICFRGSKLIASDFRKGAQPVALRRVGLQA